MIVRRRIFEKYEPSRDAQKIYIFCEGDREEDYFSFFVSISTNLEIIPFGPYNNQSDPEKLMLQAFRYFFDENPCYSFDSLEQDIIWFAIDTDTWEDEGKIEKLRAFCRSQNGTFGYDALKVAQSNPCLEIWLYYHIYELRPNEEEVGSYKTMKEFVDAKISGGFDCKTMPAFIKTAIKNAERNYVECQNGPSLFSTEVYLLGKDIWKYAGREIERKTRTFI